MRRELIVMVGILIAACTQGGGGGVGTTVPQTATSPTTTDAAPAPGTEESFPVRITHKYGITVVPAAPERVVSVGYAEQDFLLALGTTPVAVRNWYGDFPYATWPWAQDELGEAKPVVLGGELDFEVIASLQPDLIAGVTSGMTAEEYDLLSQIAPVVAQPGEYVDYGTPWPEVTRILGQALGREDRAEQLVSGLLAQMAGIRSSFPEFEGATAAVAFKFGENPGVYASQDIRSRLLQDLGFVIPPRYDELAGDAFYITMSEEQMPDLLDVDLVVWVSATDEGIEDIRSLALRPNLAVVQEGREVFLGKLLAGAYSFSSPLSLPYLLEELVPMLAAAVDGDPRTEVPPG